MGNCSKTGCLALLIAASAATDTAWSQFCEYEVVIQFEEPFFGNAINDQGQIGGSMGFGVQQAAWWDGEQVIALELPPGYTIPSEIFDINNDGVMVGEMHTADSIRGFIYDHGKFTILAPQPDGSGVYANPRAINEQGLVAGSARIEPRQLHEAYLWINGEPINLDPTPEQRSLGFDVNDQGLIVGYVGFETPSATMDARAFALLGESLFFPPLPAKSITSRAVATNNLGQILVRGVIDFDPDHFLTKLYVWDERAYTPIDGLPQFNLQGGYDINDAGQVIGVLRQHPEVDEPQDVGFLWQNGEMIRALDLLPEEHQSIVAFATAINNHGEMVVSTELATFVLRPVNSVSADITNDCTVDIRDLSFVLRVWGENNSIGDVNGDDLVDVLDLLAVLNSWG